MPSSSGASSTLPGFAPITANDKSGVLWIASLLSGIYAVLAILVRWYQKRKCFGIDDWICLAATVRLSSLGSWKYWDDSNKRQVVGGGSFIAIYFALSQGLGKTTEMLSQAALQDIGKV